MSMTTPPATDRHSFNKKPLVLLGVLPQAGRPSGSAAALVDMLNRAVANPDLTSWKRGST